jgi:hypothetical protein
VVLVETCLRKGLGLKAHRVAMVREEGDVSGDVSKGPKPGTTRRAQRKPMWIAPPPTPSVRDPRRVA